MKTQVKIPEVLFFQEGPGVRNTQYTTSGVKLLNVANLVNGKVDLSTSDRYISCDEAYNKYSHFLCEEGDFIVASSGIKVEYIDKKMGFITEDMLPLCMNTSTIRFRSLNQEVLNVRYFMYYLKSQNFKQQLEKYITGSAQLNYGPSHLAKMTIPLVDIYEQERIVEKLDKLSRVMDCRRTQFAKLDELVKCRFVELFGDMRVNTRGWENKTLGEACDVRDGTHDSPKYHTQGYPLVTSKNVTQGIIDFTDCNLICEEDYVKISKRSKVDKGDIIMPMIGTVGCPVIVETDVPFAIKNVALIKFPDKAFLLNVFVKHLLLSSYFETEVMDKVRGGTQKFVSLSDIRKLRIFIPPVELQNTFSSFVRRIDKLRIVYLLGGA